MIVFDNEWVTAYYNVMCMLITTMLIFIVLWFISDWRRNNTERMKLQKENTK